MTANPGRAQPSTPAPSAVKARAVALSLAFLLSLVACGGGDVSESAPEEPNTLGSAAPSAGAVTDEWALSPAGAGPVRVGMSLSELQPLLAEPADSATFASECAYVPITDAPRGLGFMIVAGELVRIDVREGPTLTAEGAGIGDTEARVIELYPSATRGTHKYTDGAYLVVRPGAPADTLSRLVFETDGTRVTRFRAGIYPQVEWVEGCA